MYRVAVMLFCHYVKLRRFSWYMLICKVVEFLFLTSALSPNYFLKFLLTFHSKILDMSSKKIRTKKQQN